ncbi:MAG TPA: pyridoxamine 5'-phosphate oxidase family protein [Solirubrobacterales bacterium]|nr:pyridoxamine 5'-phosphate oxidase family protein [Solirubrobacterales bacterium]
MRETEADLARLQEVLDASYAQAGPHLLRIHTPERRLDAAGIARELTGMRLLALATVSAAGKPVVGPVDGILLHGSFHFGSSPDSTRARHIARQPAVSATHLPGEELAVTVHGRAVPVDVNAADGEGAELREVLLGIYVPRYGEEWAEMLDGGAIYWRLEPERIFAFQMPPDAET